MALVRKRAKGRTLQETARRGRGSCRSLRSRHARSPKSPIVSVAVVNFGVCTEPNRNSTPLAVSRSARQQTLAYPCIF